ncbi:methyl-accepting chemotaxis protein [Shewanella youngdeokensis]|uniref:Methyl-accepting chemotaxis protein n=1 Tax=Shewanella youngdeokensis TaxID=2999068 RepID=A0ABZ0K1J5_9GAMM|nr:methyl-accepting chemotaxis protein [Shewanella sp. DAU334]
MLWFKRSLSMQLVVTIVGALAVLLTIVALWLINNESSSTRQQIDNDLSSLVQLKSNEVSSYFDAKGQLIHAIFANPSVIEWFSQYNRRSSNLSFDEKYNEIVEYFKYFSDKDSDIKSVFFGSANTFEYFDLNGRYDDTEYFTNKRPWWQEAIDQGGMFVGDPAVDANDGSISATVKTVVNDKSGRFIGIGGMDILIDTIGSELLASMNYQGAGQAFLITGDAKLVYFPGFTPSFAPGADVSQIDRQFNQTSGFSDLSQLMVSQASGFAEVTFQGQLQRVSFVEVSGSYPKQKWHLAFMLPTEIIDAPVNSLIFDSILISCFIMLLVGITVWGILLPFRQQIHRLLFAMEDIAAGDNDLSKRISMDRADELGLLSDAFNRFAAKVHGMLQQTRDLTEEVEAGVFNATQFSEKALSSVSQQKLELVSVSSAATEMAHTSQDMAASAQRASDFAHKAQAESIEGGVIVARATQGMQSLSVQVIEAAKVIKQLRTRSEQIGEVLNVIRGIAEQTNLLALNAAIEAARAGEQGRGFAVVADEVRTLASRTQDSTANIQDIILTLQQNANEAEQVMEEGVEQANQGQDLTAKVEVALGNISSAIEAIQQQTIEISAAVNQQAVVAEEVACNVDNVRELSDESLVASEALSSNFGKFSKVTEALSNNIHQFKI